MFETRKKLRISSILAALVMMLLPMLAYAQNTINVSGVVTDAAKQPVIGATVMVKGSVTGVPTDLDGRYSIQAPSNGVLEFSCVGMTTQTVNVNGKSTINVVLQEDNTFLESVVVVGYGTQKRGTITGAVAGIDSENLLKTKTENPQNMLTGRVAGLRVWQKSAEPGTYSANMDIRGLGSPLVVIDGVPRTVEDFQRLTPADIENVSVLKDASAAIYGVRGANGVVLVTTKGGGAGKAEVSYNGSFTFQTPSKMPALCNAYQAMTLYNEMNWNNINGGSVVFSEKDFADFANGTRTETDWNNLVLAKMSPQHQHDLSISGGTEKVQYYIGMGYLYQEGFFKSGDLNYNKFNLRSNVTAELAKGLKANLNLSGYLDERHNPYTSSVNIIRNYWKQGVLFPAYADPEGTMLNYDGLDLEMNTIAMMTSDISGHRLYNQKNVNAAASVEYDFGTITDALQGLKIKGLLSYDFRFDDNETYRKEYYQYAYDKISGEYIQKLYADSSPSQLERRNYQKEQKLGQVTLSYDRTFADKHKVGALFGYEAQKRDGDNYYSFGELAFSSPYFTALSSDNQMVGMATDSGNFYELMYQALIGRVNYAYDDKYIVEAQFRYDGSSKFAPGHQWGFFPSVSAAWRISEESFIKETAAGDVINQLKLRASYGVLGDDSGLNYEWISGYTYNPVGNDKGYYNSLANGYMFGDKYVFGVDTKPLPNTNITWYTSRTFNIGVDVELWNGKLGATFDYFHRKRSGLFGQNSSDLPTVVGASAPMENVNSDSHFGLEMELSHRNRVGDFSYGIKGIVTITRQKYLTFVQNGNYPNSYEKWRNDNMNNRYQGVQFGLTGNGRYESWADIWNSDVYVENNALPGNYKYEDWNGDGEISGLDRHPYAYDQTPWLNYSLAFDFQWKNLDFSMLLQGTAMGSMSYQEPLYRIWGSNGGGTLQQYWDRWHPVDPSADPWNPSTEWVSGYYAYTGTYPDMNSSFNRVSTAYLRLKQIEIGYTLPKFQKAQNFGLRIFANAYNPLTLTGVKFVDPEHPDSDLGRLYPLNKTYTIGLNLTF